MTTLYGKNYTKKELLMHIGNIQQIGGIQSFTYNEGRADGTKAIKIDTGLLSLSLLPSRCLDIAFASYKGIPFSYMSKSGIRNPSYFIEDRPTGFCENFFGGLLTTSGLNNIGAPSVVDGTNYGMHGEMSNIPADQVSVNQYWEDDELIFSVAATMHHSRFYGEDVQFKREIRTALGSNHFVLRDTIENLDFKPFPLFFLYHINFGFPLVDEHARIVCDQIKDFTARTENAKDGLSTAQTFQPPKDGIEEECFYYTFNDNDIKIAIENPSLGASGMRAYLKYDSRQFPEFTEWKMMRSREYVCGFAPGTNRLEGRAHALANEKIRTLAPLERAVFEIEMGIEELG